MVMVDTVPPPSNAGGIESPPDTTGACQRSEPLLVGLLRADGIVVPFACYVADSWQAVESIPRSISRVDRWYVTLPDSSSRWVRGGSLVQFTDGDSWRENWGQVTDFAPREIEPFSYPVARLGVALSQERELVSMKLLSTDDPQRARLLRLIRGDFDRSDTTTRRFSHSEDLSASQQVALPIRLATAARSARAVAGVRPVLVRVERAYPGCEIAALEGIVVEQEGKLSLLGPRFERYSCSEYGKTLTFPYALMPLDESAYLITEESSWEYSEKVILRITPTAVNTVVRFAAQ
jgi:hypothetical protein